MKNLRIFVLFCFVIATGSARSQVTSDTSEVFKFAEQMPEFPGGQKAMEKFIKDNTRYPVEPGWKKVPGKVIGQLIVEKDGAISNITILKGVNSSFDEEYIRIIKAMPKWFPAKQNGSPVRLTFTLPIAFKM
jgi:protein TonB